MVAEAGGRNTRNRNVVDIRQKTSKARKLKHLRRLEKDDSNMAELHIT